MKKYSKCSEKMSRNILKLYGMSQNPDSNDYILVQNNFINWTSGNKIIDNLIQEMLSNNTIFEWIPYNQFNEIKETGKNNSIIVYSAIWKNGPLSYSNKYNKYKRYSNKEVTLKCLQDSQNAIELLINEV
jgi:hypothetical protein